MNDPARNYFFSRRWFESAEEKPLPPIRSRIRAWRADANRVLEISKAEVRDAS